MTNEDFEKLLSLSKKFAQDNVHLPNASVKPLNLFIGI